jgi:hypothetical protein
MLSAVAADRIYRMLKELCYVRTRVNEESQKDFRVIVITEDTVPALYKATFSARFFQPYIARSLNWRG